MLHAARKGRRSDCASPWLRTGRLMPCAAALPYPRCAAVLGPIPGTCFPALQHCGTGDSAHFRLQLFGHTGRWWSSCAAEHEPSPAAKKQPRREATYSAMLGTATGAGTARIECRALWAPLHTWIPCREHSQSLPHQHSPKTQRHRAQRQQLVIRQLGGGSGDSPHLGATRSQCNPAPAPTAPTDSRCAGNTAAAGRS